MGGSSLGAHFVGLGDDSRFCADANNAVAPSPANVFQYVFSYDNDAPNKRTMIRVK